LVLNHGFKSRSFDALKICLQIGRNQLYHRINERCLGMIEDGLIEETERLLNKGFSPDLKSMKSLGYRHMVQFLEGRWPLEGAIHRLQRDTRRYAKRQLTWFRADPEVCWYEHGEKEKIIRNIDDFICT